MENNNNHLEGCQCKACLMGGAMNGGFCHFCHGHKKMRLFFLLRILIMIGIFSLVFGGGYKLGVLKGSFEREYRGYPTMMQKGCGYGNIQLENMAPYNVGQKTTSTVK